MTRAGFGRVDTATVTPSGNVHVGPSCAPTGSRRRPVPGIRVSCVESRRARSHFRQARRILASHRDERSRFCEEATQRQLGHHAIDSVRTFADFFEEQDAPVRRIERERSTERGHERRDRTPEQWTSRLPCPKYGKPFWCQFEPTATRQELEKRPLVVSFHHRQDVLQASVRAGPRCRTGMSARRASMCCRCSR